MEAERHEEVEKQITESEAIECNEYDSRLDPNGKTQTKEKTS
jgi:hypothetical protein